jgi:hypothetical protein
MTLLILLGAALIVVGIIMFLRSSASAPSAGGRIEGCVSLEQNEDSSGPRYSIIGLIYSDAGGEKTSRVVTIREMRVADGPGEHSTISAFCHLRHEMRTFRLDRIEGFFDPETGESMRQATLAVYDGAMPVVAGASSSFDERGPTFETLAAVADHFGARLGGLGWIVERHNIDNGEMLGCYRLKKRGVGHLKYPTVAICFEPRSIEAHAMPDGRIEHIDVGPRRKPWTVRAHDKYIGSWGTLDRALPAFLREAGIEGYDLT